MISATFPGAQFTRVQLKDSAERMGKEPQPYNGQFQANNAAFLQRLDQFSGDTVGAIYDNASAVATASAAKQLKWNVGMGASVAVGMGACLTAMYRVTHNNLNHIGLLFAVAGLGLAGQMVTMVASRTPGFERAQAEQVKQELKDWGAHLQSKAAPQPALTPAAVS